MEKLMFNKQLYSNEALIKTAYRFIDDFYIHLDAEEENYIVLIERKNNNIKVISLDIKNEFENELILQETRRIVAESTQSIREMVFARAMASTIITEPIEELDNFEEDAEEEILINWFDRYDK